MYLYSHFWIHLICLVQAHGHVQLFGWAGLLMLGVALHFLPRLWGTPLAYPAMVRWLLALLVGGLLARVISQPLLAFALPGSLAWQILLAGAGLAELAGASGIVVLLFLTLAYRPTPARRPELQAFVPYMIAGLLCFWLALALNAVEGIRLLLISQPLLEEPMDLAIVQLGLFGFLIPVALGIGARVLPLYLGVRPLTARSLWIIFCGYEIGLMLNLLSLWIDDGSGAATYLKGMAALLIGGALLAFVTVQGILLPLRRTKLVLPAVQRQSAVCCLYAPTRWHRATTRPPMAQ